MQPDVGQAGVPAQLFDSTWGFVVEMLRIPEHLPLQRAERMDQAPAVQCIDPQMSPGLQKPSELLHDRRTVCERLGHAEAQDAVELVRSEGQPSHIRDCEDGTIQPAGDGLS